MRYVYDRMDKIKFLLYIFLISLLLFSFFSCGENTRLLLDNSFSNIKLSVDPSGSLFYTGNYLPFSIKDMETLDSRPDSLEIRFFNEENTLVYVLENNNYFDENSTDNYLPIPQKDNNDQNLNGLYDLEYRVFSDKDLLINEKRSYYIYEKNWLNVNHLAVYPVTVFPSAYTLIETDISYGGPLNPYIRWKSKDKIIKEGFINEIDSSLQWQAPAEEGVYSLVLEIFPQLVEAKIQAGFTPPYKYLVEVVVSEKEVVLPGELQPLSSYYQLFHLSGDFRNQGITSQSAVFGAEALVAKKGQSFGFRLNAPELFTYPAFFFPVDENGQLQPCTLDLRLAVDQEKNNSPDFSFFSQSAENNCSIEWQLEGGEQKGEILFKMANSKTAVESRLKIEEIGEITQLGFSLIPDNSYIDFSWIVNKQVLRSERLEIKFDKELFSDGGYTRFGSLAEESSLIADELALYYKNENGLFDVDARYFSQGLLIPEGYHQITATGFDSCYLPENFILEKAGKELGFLILEKQGLFQYSFAIEKLSAFDVGFRIPQEEAAFALRFNQGERRSYQLSLVNKKLYLNGKLIQEIQQADDIYFSFLIREKALYLKTKSTMQFLFTLDENYDELTLSCSNSLSSLLEIDGFYHFGLLKDSVKSFLLSKNGDNNGRMVNIN